MATSKQAAAGFTPKRQRSQYTCMATSLSMALESCGIEVDEDTVNKVMGAAPMQGASWEQAFAASQHFGARVTFICPATLAQVKAYTDKGVAVMIAWNPEGRPWSHASVIKDVDDDGNVTVADPNIPDPDVTTRTLPKAEFYGKWFEKWDSYLVRRPAMAVEREVSPEGRQMVASIKKGFASCQRGGSDIVSRVADRHIEAFQYALAQAFADQVGMPDRMTLAQLNNALAEAFKDLAYEAEWLLQGKMVAKGEGSIELSTGPAHYRWDEPPDAPSGNFDVPMGAEGIFVAKVDVRTLAWHLLSLKTPTQFFKHKRNEIENFLASTKNRAMLEKFLGTIGLKDVVQKIDLNEAYQDELDETFEDAKGNSDIVGTGRATSFDIEGLKWDFKGNELTFTMKVYFEYDDMDDVRFERSYDGPDDLDYDY